MPKAAQFFRVLKPNGTFVLNIKEKVVDGERHTYVLELILEMRRQGWLWTEEYMWHKKILFRVNGLIVSATLGNVVYNLINNVNFLCIKSRLWFQWGIGLRQD